MHITSIYYLTQYNIEQQQQQQQRDRAKKNGWHRTVGVCVFRYRIDKLYGIYIKRKTCFASDEKEFLSHQVS